MVWLYILLLLMIMVGVVGYQRSKQVQKEEKREHG